MSHRRSILRSILRFFNLDAHFKTCLSKRLGNVCGCCGADATNKHQHASNCLSQLATLPTTESYAELQEYWRIGSSLKELDRFPSSAKGYAYYMGRHWRLPLESTQVVVYHQQPVAA